MSAVGQRELEAQKRVVALFKDKLGYEYLGDWADRENSNIEKKWLRKSLEMRGCEPGQAEKAVKFG